MKSQFLIASILLSLALLFQNCSQIDSLIVEKNTAEKTLGASQTIGGNGEPYGGKVSKYYAFMEGFVCKDSAGNASPSPYSVFQKEGDVIRLTEQACEAKNQVIQSAEVKIETSEQSAIFDFRRFYKEVPLAGIILPTFSFDEAFCSETLESRIYREYGVPYLGPDEMKTAVADLIEVRITSTFYGQKMADVVVTKDLPISLTYPAQVEVSRFSIPITTAVVGLNSTSYSSTTKSFDMMIEKNKILPVNFKANYEGVLSFNDNNQSVSGVKITCPIYPHF